jgi:hypothetical protein
MRYRLQSVEEVVEHGEALKAILWCLDPENNREKVVILLSRAQGDDLRRRLGETIEAAFAYDDEILDREEQEQLDREAEEGARP